MSEFLIPILYQLGIGGIGGFFIGYVVKRVIRIAMIIGVFVLFLLYLAYKNVINVNYNELIEIARVTEPTLGLFAPLLSALPFSGSFFVGLMYGLKKG